MTRDELLSRVVNESYYAAAACVCIVKGHHWGSSKGPHESHDFCTRCYHTRHWLTF